MCAVCMRCVSGVCAVYPRCARCVPGIVYIVLLLSFKSCRHAVWMRISPLTGGGILFAMALGTSSCSAHNLARHILLLDTQPCSAHLALLGTSSCSAHNLARHSGDSSNNVNLGWLDLSQNGLSGNVHSDHQRSESKPHSFILGEIGDFSNNVNLVTLDLSQNGLSGNGHSDHHRSESKCD